MRCPWHGLVELRGIEVAVFFGGALIGTLGGLIGLGAAEFRLPLLIGMFRFPALEAVILNKITSLVVVVTALLFRTQAVPFADVAANWPIIVNLLAGSLIGAWMGATWATRLKSETLYYVIAVMLVLIADSGNYRGACRPGDDSQSCMCAAVFAWRAWRISLSRSTPGGVP